MVRFCYIGYLLALRGAGVNDRKSISGKKSLFLRTHFVTCYIKKSYICLKSTVPSSVRVKLFVGPGEIMISSSTILFMLPFADRRLSDEKKNNYVFKIRMTTSTEAKD